MVNHPNRSRAAKRRAAEAAILQADLEAVALAFVPDGLFAADDLANARKAILALIEMGWAPPLSPGQ